MFIKKAVVTVEWEHNLKKIAFWQVLEAKKPSIQLIEQEKKRLRYPILIYSPRLACYHLIGKPKVNLGPEFHLSL